MNIVYKARVLLIRLGKVLPFLLCAAIIISYTETILSLTMNNFVEWNGYVIPNKSISWFIGTYFEYDLFTLAALVVLSISIQTCLYNKLSCAYLGVNLVEKSYFDFEIEPIYIYVICIANIMVAGYLIYRGIKNLLK